VGPAPLPEGEEPWPTTIEVVQGENKVYIGEPVTSPSGEVIDPEPNYGVGRTLDYVIRDQAKNPMGPDKGVLLRENIEPGNDEAKLLMGRVGFNKNPDRPDERGIVPDTVGAISRDSRIMTFLSRYQIDALFVQTITIYGTAGKEYRTALILNMQYRLTNAGVQVTVGQIEQRQRPK
jgi:hypothetical protein